MKKDTTKKPTNRPDGFIFLPRWFWESDKIKAQDRSLCITLAYHRNKHTKLCYPSRATIRKEAGLAQNTYYKIRNKLQKIGLISFENSSGGRKKSVEFKLNWLDSSKEEIEELKETLKLKKPYQIDSGLKGRNRIKSTQVNRIKSTQVNRIKSTQRTTKNINNKEYEQQQGQSAADSSLRFSKEETKRPLILMFNDTGWETLSEKTLLESVDKAIIKGKTDIREYFRWWKKEIDKKKGIHNKPGLLIDVVNKGADPPGYPLPLLREANNAS